MVTPALSHSTGPSCAKYALGSPAKSQPHSAASPMERMAEPGSAKATGKPELKAPTMSRIRTARKKSSMNAQPALAGSSSPRRRETLLRA